MLVLSRKKNERVMINNDIRVIVVEIRRDKVRLGFEAPAGVQIHREEVWVQIQQQEGCEDAQPDITGDPGFGE